jgi:hypothetical protein
MMIPKNIEMVGIVFLFTPRSQVALGERNGCQAELGGSKHSQAYLGNEKKTPLPRLADPINYKLNRSINREH